MAAGCAVMYCNVGSFAIRVARYVGARAAVRMTTPTRAQASRGPSVAGRRTAGNGATDWVPWFCGMKATRRQTIAWRADTFRPRAATERAADALETTARAALIDARVARLTSRRSYLLPHFVEPPRNHHQGRPIRRGDSSSTRTRSRHPPRRSCERHRPHTCSQHTTSSSTLLRSRAAMRKLMTHLAQFGSLFKQGELLCTQSLSYLLEHNAAREAFATFISRSSGVNVSAALDWRAEVPQQGPGAAGP